MKGLRVARRWENGVIVDRIVEEFFAGQAGEKPKRYIDRLTTLAGGSLTSSQLYEEVHPTLCWESPGMRLSVSVEADKMLFDIKHPSASVLKKLDELKISHAGCMKEFVGEEDGQGGHGHFFTHTISFRGCR